MWRNMMALKRAGRGNASDGVSTTPKGGLMVECPACPHLGRNLPDNWKDAGPLLFLYTLFIAVDANFKLRRKERHLTDIELMYGQGAFVEENTYQTHIKNYVDQPEINTCESQHDAVVRAATCQTAGYTVSGVVAVIYSRHAMIRKNGAGDLQKGEKYCNVDFVIFAALVGITVLRLVLTYDIVCQWSKNFQKRMAEFPPDMQIPDSTKVDVAIPGWHINGHGDKCRNNFNLSHMEGVGRTVGEDIETTWAGTNPLAPAVQEMGPAARHDTLNNHWNGWNFHKIVGFRKLFAKRFQEAMKMSVKQAEIFDQMSSTFPSDVIQKWEVMVNRWNKDPKALNPYAEPKSTTTMNDVRLVLAQEEAADASLGRVHRHKMSMTTFIIKGFELEDSQYILRREFAKTKGLRTSKQLADLQEKRNGLFHLIQNWREVQFVYMPHVASLIPSLIPNSVDNETDIGKAGTSHHTGILAENIPLFLPSGLPYHLRHLPELDEISRLELRLRIPQASDALASVRRQLRIIHRLWQFKRLNASGVGNKPNTKMVTLYKRFDMKTQRAANEYRAAWRALRVLDPNGSWSSTFQELKDQDIKGPGREQADPTPNSRYVPTWIWLTRHDTAAIEDQSIKVMRGDDEEFHESMRVEWARARARKSRWAEELLLVQEEMRRVIEYLHWKSRWWVDSISLQPLDDPAKASGISGYSHKQAAICVGIALQCASEWIPRLRAKGITPTWGSYFPALMVAPMVVRPSRHSDAQGAEDLRGNVDNTDDDEDDQDDITDNEDKDDADLWDLDD